MMTGWGLLPDRLHHDDVRRRRPMVERLERNRAIWQRVWNERLAEIDRQDELRELSELGVHFHARADRGCE